MMNPKYLEMNLICRNHFVLVSYAAGRFFLGRQVSIQQMAEERQPKEKG